MFVHLRSCEKFGLDPLRFFMGKKADWGDMHGEAMRILLIAYNQLIAEEEDRIHEEMRNNTKQANPPPDRNRRKTRPI